MNFEFLLRLAHSRSRVDVTYWSGRRLNSRVWPYAKGTVRGISFLPLHRSVPEAALRNTELYEMQALVDAIRDGRAREREIAVRELTQRIDQAW